LDRRDGHTAQPPLSPVSALGSGALTAAGTVTALAVLLWSGVLVTRRLLDRRRLLDWDVEWRRLSPQWT
jgi:hypothetical protein